MKASRTDPAPLCPGQEQRVPVEEEGTGCVSTRVGHWLNLDQRPVWQAEGGEWVQGWVLSLRHPEQLVLRRNPGP